MALIQVLPMRATEGNTAIEMIEEEASQAMQTIRGEVVDAASGEPMMGVSICVEDMPEARTITDMNGGFVLVDVPVGRHNIKATYIGYEPLVMMEQLLSSGKEMVLHLRMTENISSLKEVVVRPRTNKQMPLNDMAQVGARMFSTEETARYAGGIGDPARTASMFAGVASGGAANGISIHGNAPQMLQWRIEGVEVNNPNHFADITEAGGGIFSSLNGLMLANSDFLMGAMPADYGNALAGAFDMKMRTGNNMHHEHALQVGTLGVEFASEGPLGKAKSGQPRASYLVDYRYSFMELAKKVHAINMDHETMDYQDLSFKLNFPTAHHGTYSIWFTGLIDNYHNDVDDPSEWETLWDMNKTWTRQRNWAGGITHTRQLRSGGTLTSRLATTGTYLHLGVTDYDQQMVATPDMAGRSTSWNIIASVEHKRKFSSRYTMQNGFVHQYMDFSTHLDHIQVVGGPMARVYESDGDTHLTRFYTNHKIGISHRLSMVAGANLMWFHLNRQWMLEPRVSMQWKASGSSTLSVAYALNSRKETTDTYFVLQDGRNPNKNLSLTQSHYLSASFAQSISEHAMFKVEPYWQYLFNVPVERGTTFSVLNHLNFYQDRVLISDGAARNYGVDFTLEHFLKEGRYGMFTATLFKSEYRDAQREWHHSRYDRGYIINALGGKEWMVGRERKNVFGLNFRFTLMGGDRYTPIPDNLTYDEVAKRPDRSIPEDGARAFSKQMHPSLTSAFSLKYTVNGRHSAKHIMLEFLKVRTFRGQTYDLRTKEPSRQYTELTFPNLAYRIEF